MKIDWDAIELFLKENKVKIENLSDAEFESFMNSNLDLFHFEERGHTHKDFK